MILGHLRKRAPNRGLCWLSAQDPCPSANQLSVRQVSAGRGTLTTRRAFRDQQRGWVCTAGEKHPPNRFWLNKRDGRMQSSVMTFLTGNVCHLPTEAVWERWRREGGGWGEPSGACLASCPILQGGPCTQGHKGLAWGPQMVRGTAATRKRGSWLLLSSVPSFHVFLGFPCGSAGKESTCNAGDLGPIPGLGRPPGEGKGYPLQFWPGEFHGLYNLWGRQELDTTEGLSLHVMHYFPCSALFNTSPVYWIDFTTNWWAMTHGSKLPDLGILEESGQGQEGSLRFTLSLLNTVNADEENSQLPPLKRPSLVAPTVVDTTTTHLSGQTLTARSHS